MISSKTNFKIVVVIFGALWFLLLIFILAHTKSKLPERRKFKTQSSFRDLNFKADLKKLTVNILEGLKVSSKNLTRISAGDKNRPSEISVVISGDASSIFGVISTINSIRANTKWADILHFYVSLPKEIIPHFNSWVENSFELSELKFTVRGHPSSIPEKKPHYVKLFILELFPEIVGMFFYVDSDVIIQGDINELINLPLKKREFALAPSECQTMYKRTAIEHPYYSSHLNLSHQAVKSLRMNPKKCTFNTDVFIANTTAWRRYKVQDAIHHWIKVHEKGPSISGSESSSDMAEAVILIIFYHRTGSFPPLWHVGHLGWKPGSSLSSSFISKAKLLHWNGRFKPWHRKSPFNKVWFKYYIPDPNRHFKLASLI